MKLAKIGLVSALAALSLGLVACSSSENSKTNVEINRFDHSCQFGPDDGSGSWSDQSESIAATYFQKRFNIGAWQAISKTSMRQTVNYIETNLGAQVYKSRRAGHKCAPFDFLPAADGNALNFWQKANSGASSLMGTLLGLYVAPPQGDVTEPTIMIVSDADRWTIVHEMTHHLFQLYRMNQPGYQDINQLERQRDFLENRFQFDVIYCESHTCKQADIDSDFAAYAKTIDQALLQFSLEEMTIEAEMSEAFHAGFFGAMPDDTRNSIDYIASSAESAGSEYEKFEKVISALKRDGSAHPALDEVERLSTSRLAEIQSVLNEVETVDGPPDAHLAGNGSRLASYEKHPTCTHNKEDKFIESLDRVSNLLVK